MTSKGAIPRDTAEAAIDANVADVMSLSYGEVEASSGPDIALANELWEQAASQGQTIVVSAVTPARPSRMTARRWRPHGITVSGLSSTAWNV